MKKQINPTIKAYLIRGAFYLLLLLAVCAIPFALAQSRSRGTTKPGVIKPTVLPNLTSLSSTISTTHTVPVNPDFAPPGVIQGQLSSLRTDGVAALQRRCGRQEFGSATLPGGWLRHSRALADRHAWPAGSLSCRWMHRFTIYLRVRRW